MRLQAHSHHRILSQFVGGRTQSQHALPLRASRLAHTHAAQVIVEDRASVPLEHAPPAVPIVTLALTAILAAAVAVNGGTHAGSSYHAPLQVVLCYMHIDLLQTLIVFHLIQLMQEINLWRQRARMSPHQLARVPLLSLRSLFLQSFFSEPRQCAWRNRPGHLPIRQSPRMPTTEIRPR